MNHRKNNTTMEEQIAWEQFDMLKAMEKKEEVKKSGYEFYFCASCGGQKVFIPGDLPVCGSCGLVDTEYISEEPEWASGIDNDGEVTDGSRVGAPLDLELFSSKWGSGCVMTTSSHASYYTKKLARIHFHSSMNHKDRALHHAYMEFERVKVRLGISDAIIRIAKIKYREITESKLTRGAVRMGVKANCVFQACKEMNVPRTTKEIADAFDISAHDMGRTSSILDTGADVKVTQARDLINRILSKMEVADIKTARKKMYAICDAVENCPKLMGKTPNGVACAIIYTVLAQEGVTKQMVCTAAEVSVPTLNKIEALVKQEIS